MTASEPTDRITVLVADDEAPIRLLVRVNLQAEGFAVVEAKDGPTALEAVRDHMPDIVLLDIMMPLKDGWEVAAEMLADARTERIPIIFLTARADLRDHERGLTSGALLYITKPFNPRDLAPAIEECLAASRSGEAEAMRADRLRTVQEMQGVRE